MRPDLHESSESSSSAASADAEVDSLSWFHSTVAQSDETLARAEDMLARYEDARQAIHDEYGEWFSGAARRGNSDDFDTFEKEYLARCHSIALVMPVDTDAIRTDVTISRSLHGLIRETYGSSVADFKASPGVAAMETAQGRWQLASKNLEDMLAYNVEAAKHLSWVETTLERGRREFSSDVQYSGIELDPLIDAAMAAMREKVVGYLEDKIGANGAGFTRSRPLRAFRQRMKDAARDQARQDVDSIASQGGPVTATSDYVATDAKPRVYDIAKQSVDRRLQELAGEQAQRIVGDKRADLRAAGNGAALDALSSGGDGATKAARKAIEARAKQLENLAVAEAQTWKQSLIKNPDLAERDTLQSAEEANVREQASRDGAGQKALEQSITANTTDEGLGKVGQLLDSTLPQAGDSASVKIELQIPIGQSPGFVFMSLEGTAARGTDGAVTAGIPVLGENPKRMEAMFQFKLGAGVETWGLRADGSIGFFLRSGGEDTSAAMKAMSYGAYRAACGLSDGFGNWWSGSTQGTGRSKKHKAESWAAMIEEQVFDADDSAFVHMGASAGVGASLNVGVGSGSASFGAARFRKWNKDTLQDSLGDAFAQPVASDEAASERRSQASGVTGVALGGSVKVSADILGQGVDFSASLSGPKKDFSKNWGLEITSGVSLPPGADASTFATIAAGIVTGALSAAQSMSAVVKSDKSAGARTMDLYGDVMTIANAGMENQISTYLSELWHTDKSRSGESIENLVKPASEQPDLAGAGTGLDLGSSIQVAILIGRGDGNGIFRIELRSSKSAAVKIGLGNVGLSGSIERTKRLAAFGYENQGVRGELLGNPIG